MEIRFYNVAYTLVLATGLATLVGCDAGGSTVPNSLAPGTSTNTPTAAPKPTSAPTATPKPTSAPTATPTPALTKSATVSWTAPLARVDGTAASMNEIGGYNIYYGTSPTVLSKVVRVPDAYTYSYSVGNLAVSTYYFAVSAIDSKGVESALSNIVTRIVK